MDEIKHALTINEFAENLAAIVERVADTHERVLVESPSGAKVWVIADANGTAGSTETSPAESAILTAEEKRRKFLSLAGILKNVEAEKVFIEMDSSRDLHAKYNMKASDFDYYAENMLSRARAKGESLRVVARDGEIVEFTLERVDVSEDGVTATSEETAAFLASFGTWSNEDAETLGMRIEDSRNIMGRVFDFL